MRPFTSIQSPPSPSLSPGHQRFLRSPVPLHRPPSSNSGPRTFRVKRPRRDRDPGRFIECIDDYLSQIRCSKSHPGEDMKNVILRRPCVLATILCASFGLLASCDMPTDDSAPEPESTETTSQPLTNSPHKMCSAITGGNWRDTIIVDNGWSLTTCQGWAASVSATSWQVGCLNTNGFSWGNGGYSVPSPNCGWF